MLTVNWCVVVFATATSASPTWNCDLAPAPSTVTRVSGGQKWSGVHCTVRSSIQENCPGTGFEGGDLDTTLGERAIGHR